MMADNIKKQEQLNSSSESKHYVPPLDNPSTTTLLKNLLNESVVKCYTKDNVLIKKGMEQASAARIFYYMQNAIDTDKRFQIFKNYNLDCEYYKNINAPKITPSKPYGSRPDLILHKRESNKNNILVCEFKSTNDNNHSDYESDYNKLKDFTSNSGIYRYKLGVFVRLNSENPSYVYFKEGEKLLNQDLLIPIISRD